jgi:hypothetical protein
VIWRPPPRRTQPPKPSPASLGAQALAELQRAEFDAKPWGACGELLAGGLGQPQPPPAPVPFVIPPPDWSAELRERRERGDDAEPEQQPPAIVAMRGAEYDPPAPGPPEVSAPLQRFQFPDVDWQAELRERERQAARERAAGRELEPDQSAYPAKRRRAS